MLLRQDWPEDLSTRAKTQPNGGEFRSETRRSTLEGLKVAGIGQPRSPLSGDYPWNIVETPLRKRARGAPLLRSQSERQRACVVSYADGQRGRCAEQTWTHSRLCSLALTETLRSLDEHRF